MNELNNTLWMVTTDNTYSYDNIEKRTFISSDEKSAKDKFKETVKEYINEELLMANELFDKEFSSLEDIISYIEELKKSSTPVYIGSATIVDLDFSYGIDVSEDKSYALFTIFRENTLLFNNSHREEEYQTESVYVILRKIELNKENTEYGIPCLENVSEIKSLLETI